jgi:hypothetical protein
MFPWFPNPFYNRHIVIRLNKNKVGIFFTRKNFFYVYDSNKLKKEKFDFTLKGEKVTNSDKKAFFKQCELVSHGKFSHKTKNSIVFPKTKELFEGVIKWDNSIALLLKDRFLIFSQNGKYLTSINYPKILRARTFSDYNARPENIFVKDKYLYVLNEDNCIEIFNLKF